MIDTSVAVKADLDLDSTPSRRPRPSVVITPVVPFSSNDATPTPSGNRSAQRDAATSDKMNRRRTHRSTGSVGALMNTNVSVSSAEEEEFDGGTLTAFDSLVEFLEECEPDGEGDFDDADDDEFDFDDVHGQPSRLKGLHEMAPVVLPLSKVTCISGVPADVNLDDYDVTLLSVSTKLTERDLNGFVLPHRSSARPCTSTVEIGGAKYAALDMPVSNGYDVKGLVAGAGSQRSHWIPRAAASRRIVISPEIGELPATSIRSIHAKNNLIPTEKIDMAPSIRKLGQNALRLRRTTAQAHDEEMDIKPMIAHTAK